MLTRLGMGERFRAKRALEFLLLWRRGSHGLSTRLLVRWRPQRKVSLQLRHAPSQCRDDVVQIAPEFKRLIWRDARVVRKPGVESIELLLIVL
jgi:hypothetical protein